MNHQLVSFPHIPKGRVCLSFSAWPAGLQMQFPTAVLQAFHSSKLHAMAGNQKWGECSWAPTCGAIALSEKEKIRVSS